MRGFLLCRVRAHDTSLRRPLLRRAIGAARPPGPSPLPPAPCPLAPCPSRPHSFVPRSELSLTPCTSVCGVCACTRMCRGVHHCGIPRAALRSVITSLRDPFIEVFLLGKGWRKEGGEGGGEEGGEERGEGEGKRKGGRVACCSFPAMNMNTSWQQLLSHTCYYARY